MNMILNGKLGNNHANIQTVDNRIQKGRNMEKIIGKDMIANGLKNKNIKIDVDYSGWWIDVRSEKVKLEENMMGYPFIYWGWPDNHIEVYPKNFTFDKLVDELYKAFEYMRTSDAHRNRCHWLFDGTYDEYALAYDCLAN